jgi:NTE family protein
MSRYLVILLVVLAVGCAPKKLVIAPEFLPPPRIIENVNVALALGGGGSKGFVHLGVLEVLEENGIPIDLIVGTSAGSIIGAFYADYGDIKLVKERLLGLTKWAILDISVIDSLYYFIDTVGPVRGNSLEELLVTNLTVNNMEDLKIPFVAVASDLSKEKSVVISSGPIATAVRASAAFPGIFSPVKEYGMFLVDGGVTEPVPVLTAKSYNPKVTISVDISTPGFDLPMNNMFHVTSRSLYLSYYKLSRLLSGLADVTIHPKNLDSYELFTDEHNYELYELGKKEAMKHIGEIKRLLLQKGIKLRNPKLIY